MLWINGKKVASLWINGKPLILCRRKSRIWEAIGSCFGSGRWSGRKPWRGKDKWRY